MNLFQNVQVRKPQRNKFDLSHEKKLTCNMGALIPILCEEVLPGESFNCNTELLIRFTPLQAPIYQRIKSYTHFFFVPTRLVWDEFKDFITGGKDGTAAPVAPYFQVQESNRASFAIGELSDFLGIPVPQTGTIINPAKISALQFRAYQLIYNEYYRDETLHVEVPFTKTSGLLGSTETGEITALRARCWEKDYFTSALPWPQRGATVGMPMTMSYKTISDVKYSDGSTPGAERTLSADPGGTLGEIGSGLGLRIENLNANPTSTSINDLRRAIRLQEWLERNARGGYRYIEQILSHFGIVSSDARLQRPEYLGGGNSPIIISEVLSTFQDPAAAGDPQGSMAGHAIGVAGGHGFGNKRFEEHGFIIGIMSVLPKVGYSQGIPKQFQRFDKLDYAWPEFSQIGEQAIRMSEIYHDYLSGPTQGDNTFGYQSRYAEYKYKCNSIHGDFRNNLAYWHQDQVYTTAPVLNGNFVTANPSNRIFAVTTPATHKLMVQLHHNLHAIRPLPYYGTPTL